MRFTLNVVIQLKSTPNVMSYFIWTAFNGVLFNTPSVAVRRMEVNRSFVIRTQWFDEWKRAGERSSSECVRSFYCLINSMRIEFNVIVSLKICLPSKNSNVYLCQYLKLRHIDHITRVPFYLELFYNRELVLLFN